MPGKWTPEQHEKFKETMEQKRRIKMLSKDAMVKKRVAAKAMHKRLKKKYKKIKSMRRRNKIQSREVSMDRILYKVLEAVIDRRIKAFFMEMGGTGHGEASN
jgi:hypothetical protein